MTLKLRPFTCVALSLLLSACAAPSLHGQLQTTDNKPFTFSADGDRLLLSPGPMDAEMGANPKEHGKIRLKNGNGEIEIKTPPEAFELNHFSLPAGPGKLSNDLKGAWRETTLGLSNAIEMDHCTTPGYCPEVQRRYYTKCSSGNYDQGSKKAKEHAKTERCEDRVEEKVVYPTLCSGRQPVQKTYQDYTLTLELEFFSPGEPGRRTGIYQGNSAPQKRVVNRQIMGPCLIGR